MNAETAGSCSNRPVTNRVRLDAIRVLRQTPEFNFSGRGARRAPQNPMLNYEVAFLRIPNPLVELRVNNYLQGAKAAIKAGLYGDYRGYIYVFHDLADPDNVVKIGRTERDPRKRIAEWNRELAETSGHEQNIVMLFAYPTVANVLAERIVHETLRCEHIGDRLSINSGDELSEFFRISNFRALKIFLRQTLAFVDQLVTTALLQM